MWDIKDIIPDDKGMSIDARTAWDALEKYDTGTAPAKPVYDKWVSIKPEEKKDEPIEIIDIVPEENTWADIADSIHEWVWTFFNYAADVWEELGKATTKMWVKFIPNTFWLITNVADIAWDTIWLLGRAVFWKDIVKWTDQWWLDSFSDATNEWVDSFNEDVDKYAEMYWNKNKALDWTVFKKVIDYTPDLILTAYTLWAGSKWLAKKAMSDKELQVTVMKAAWDMFKKFGINIDSLPGYERIIAKEIKNFNKLKARLVKQEAIVAKARWKVDKRVMDTMQWKKVNKDVTQKIDDKATAMEEKLTKIKSKNIDDQLKSTANREAAEKWKQAALDNTSKLWKEIDTYMKANWISLIDKTKWFVKWNIKWPDDTKIQKIYDLLLKAKRWAISTGKKIIPWKKTAVVGWIWATWLIANEKLKTMDEWTIDKPDNYDEGTKNKPEVKPEDKSWLLRWDNSIWEFPVGEETVKIYYDNWKAYAKVWKQTLELAEGSLEEIQELISSENYWDWTSKYTDYIKSLK